MNNIPEHIEDIIYRYKHEMVFSSVIKEFNLIIDCWCDEQLSYRYRKCRHQQIYNKCRNEFKCLNDYEEHLCITLEPNDMFDIINDEYFTQLL